MRRCVLDACAAIDGREEMDRGVRVVKSKMWRERDWEEGLGC